MILHVPNVLNEEQVAHCRDVIQHATWVDGRVTAGYQSASVKDNRQLPEDSKEAHELGDMIVAALERHPMFISAALPLPCVSSAVQPLRCRHVVWTAPGQLHPTDHRHTVPCPY